MLRSGVWADRLRGIAPEDITDLSDLSTLPTTVKSDLSPPLCRLIVPRRDVVRILSLIHI